MYLFFFLFFFSSRRRHTRCALVTGVQTCALPISASGCGTTIKDYGFMLRDDPAYADKAARVSALARDVSELLADIPLPPGDGRGLTVADRKSTRLNSSH